MQQSALVRKLGSASYPDISTHGTASRLLWTDGVQHSGGWACGSWRPLLCLMCARAVRKFLLPLIIQLSHGLFITVMWIFPLSSLLLSPSLFSFVFCLRVSQIILPVALLRLSGDPTGVSAVYSSPWAASLRDTCIWLSGHPSTCPRPGSGAQVSPTIPDEVALACEPV